MAYCITTYKKVPALTLFVSLPPLVRANDVCVNYFICVRLIDVVFFHRSATVATQYGSNHTITLFATIISLVVIG
mgnify:CR=1 FL=1